MSVHYRYFCSGSGWVLFTWLALILPVRATVLWSYPGSVLVCNTNCPVMRGTVAPQGSNSTGALYFRVLLDPIADSATKASKPFEAGFMLVEQGQEHLGVGDALNALAYSCLNVPKAPKGFQDLNSRTPDLQMHEYIRAGIPRYAVLKVEYVPGQDARVTAWLSPDLSMTATEFNQPPGSEVHFETKATFDEFRVMHRGLGAGWRFSQMLAATTFEDLRLLPFWQQTWFLIILLVGLPVILAGSVWGLERRRARRMLQHLEQERAVAAERTRIAQDIHDEVGTSLTKISKLTNMLTEHPVN
ncbi:MAG TPA: histidine kinase, partial [Verrucomicrobiae bacterium]